MNCGEWEKRAALHAGAGVVAEDALAVDGHVAECAACGAHAPTDFVERYFRRRV